MTTINNLKPTQVLQDVLECQKFLKPSESTRDNDSMRLHEIYIAMNYALQYPGTTVSLSLEDSYLIKRILNRIAELELNPEA
jgi:hypothetical protein